MPQMSKGGKYIFGWSEIREDGALIFPVPAVGEYKLHQEQYIYIVSGSKQMGGFCVMSEPLLSRSKLNHILKENPRLADRTLKEGELISYKGRKRTSARHNSSTLYHIETFFTWGIFRSRGMGRTC